MHNMEPKKYIIETSRVTDSDSKVGRIQADDYSGSLTDECENITFYENGVEVYTIRARLVDAITPVFDHGTNVEPVEEARQ